MSVPNKFKYRCTTCGATEFIHQHLFARATKPRCSACGSYGLEATHDEAAAVRRYHEAVAHEAHMDARDKQNPETADGK